MDGTDSLTNQHTIDTFTDPVECRYTETGFWLHLQRSKRPPAGRKLLDLIDAALGASCLCFQVCIGLDLDLSGPRSGQNSGMCLQDLASIAVGGLFQHQPEGPYQWPDLGEALVAQGGILDMLFVAPKGP